MKLTHALAATLTAGTLVLAPGTAHAESKYHLDPAGDMGKLTQDMYDDEDAQPIPGPERAESDIRSIRVTHLARNVRVAMTYRALNRVGLVKFIGVRVVSDTGVREIDVTADDANWRGVREVVNGAGKAVRCAGLTHHLDYGADKVLFVIPRTCLAHPRWVRVAGFTGVIAHTGNTQVPGFTTYIDDARSSNYWGAAPVAGPKVRKG